jgi:EmrB/QacA subfamily drug resistance transporter
MWIAAGLAVLGVTLWRLARRRRGQDTAPVGGGAQVTEDDGGQVAQATEPGQVHAQAAVPAPRAGAAAAESGEADPRRWWILAVLCVSLLLVAMDNSVLNVAVPALSRSLHADTSGVQLIVDAFTVVYGGLLMAAGSLADRWGRKRALLAGLAVFGAGSAAASLAGSAGALTGLRAVMGAGAALVMPATLAIINSLFAGPERARAIGAWSAMSGAGLALGPLVGGALLERFWWGSVFLVNVPVAAAGLAAVWFLVPDFPGHGARGDLPGGLLSVIGLGSAVYAVIEGPSRGWDSPAVLAGFAAGAAGLAAFIAWEARTAHPMLPLSFFRSPRFTGAITVLALMFLVLLGSNFLISQYFQFVRGLSALAAGAAFLPLAVALLAVSPFSHRLTTRLGIRTTVAGAVLVAAAGTALLALSSPSSPLAVTEAGLALVGAGMGGVIAPAVTSILGSVPPQQAGVASAVNSASLQAGGAIGVAVLGAVFSAVYTSRITPALGSIPPAAASQASQSPAAAFTTARHLPGTAGHLLAQAAQDAFTHGLAIALITATAAAIAAAIAALAFLPGNRPR